MIWIAYNVLFSVGYLLMLPYFIFRMARRGGYLKGFLQRFCVYSDSEKARIMERPRVWVHAVSVGEVQVALRFIEEFRAQEPGAAFLLSTTTSTGHAIAAGKLSATDVLAYFPVDFPVVIRKALALFKPRCLVLIEGELWPNLIRIAAACGVPVCVVNGRLSEKSERRYRMVKVFFKNAINKMTLVCVQTQADERRLLALGARPELVRVMGSAKYDVARADGTEWSAVEAVLRTLGVGRDDLLIVGGSTWPGEEAILADVFKRLRGSITNLRLVVVPRHAERASNAVSEISGRGLCVSLRSSVGKPGHEHGEVIVVDTTGELMGFYSRACVVFVGKSLTAHGGQNIIEPAILGKPIVVGPNMQNFSGIISDFLDADAVIQIADAAGLEAAFRQLLCDSALRQKYGARAAALVLSKKGSLRATVELVRKTLKT